MPAQRAGGKGSFSTLRKAETRTFCQVWRERERGREEIDVGNRGSNKLLLMG